MRGRPSVWRRMRVVSGVYRTREQARITRLLCELEGIDPVAFESECRAMEARFKQEGITTRREQEERMAADLGIPIEEFRAEVDVITAQVLELHEAGR